MDTQQYSLISRRLFEPIAKMVVCRQGNRVDIEGVLSLQSKNLVANLTEEEKAKGFVTTPFTQKQIEQIIDEENGLFVAEDKSDIVGYIFAGSWGYFSQWEIFKYMVSRFPQLEYQNQAITTENTFQYGPVCLDILHRGTALFNELFEEMRLLFVKRYPISITFINQVNAISTAAHTRKLGWQIIDEFNFNGNQYYGLAIDMNSSVLPQI